eukprot:TRINITY_DN10837_c0_g1_i1.p1 TRINITY_DN10837_c0_g1~~TRINITY_DN10837_c0_g1_i1.p1  ORF type:complete len:117 (+),score=0.17 TRINITY_DN10837_c0_g1_i1:138-488(+)
MEALTRQVKEVFTIWQQNYTTWTACVSVIKGLQGRFHFTICKGENIPGLTNIMHQPTRVDRFIAYAPPYSNFKNAFRVSTLIYFLFFFSFFFFLFFIFRAKSTKEKKEKKKVLLRK